MLGAQTSTRFARGYLAVCCGLRHVRHRRLIGKVLITQASSRSWKVAEASGVEYEDTSFELQGIDQHGQSGTQ
jgi:hypothetical protein